MIDPPIYPTWLVQCVGYSHGKIGNARFRLMGWDLLFNDGSLRISEPTGTHVLDLGPDDTERFVGLVRALDQGRVTCADFKARDKE